MKKCKYYGITCECNHFENLPKCYEPIEDELDINHTISETEDRE